MRGRLTNLFPSRCKHPQRVVIRSSGIERNVCESCGHISFSFDGGDPYPVDYERAEEDLTTAKI